MGNRLMRITGVPAAPCSADGSTLAAPGDRRPPETVHGVCDDERHRKSRQRILAWVCTSK